MGTGHRFSWLLVKPHFLWYDLWIRAAPWQVALGFHISFLDNNSWNSRCPSLLIFPTKSTCTNNFQGHNMLHMLHSRFVFPQKSQTSVRCRWFLNHTLLGPWKHLTSMLRFTLTTEKLAIPKEVRWRSEMEPLWWLLFRLAWRCYFGLVDLQKLRTWILGRCACLKTRCLLENPIENGPVVPCCVSLQKVANVFSRLSKFYLPKQGLDPPRTPCRKVDRFPVLCWGRFFFLLQHLEYLSFAAF